MLFIETTFVDHESAVNYGMATDYEKIYREQRHALGAPTRALVEFFELLPAPLRIFDVGCGQGRDALFIARLGHQVVGVDLSISGIAQLGEDAEREGVGIEAIVADIVDYAPAGVFDVMLFDRTLHMLPPTDRLRVLDRYRKHVGEKGYVLISDERKNLPAMESLFMQSDNTWRITRKTRGLLFFQKVS